MSEKPKFYECGICGSHHSSEFGGDCREDEARMDPDELDEKFGVGGWEEVPMSDDEPAVGDGAPGMKI